MIQQSKIHQGASRILLLLITVALQLGISNVNAQQRTKQSQASATARQAPRTVLDFYMLLTPEELTPLEVIKNRKSLIEVQDIKNGYLKLKGNADWEGSGEIALFKKNRWQLPRRAGGNIMRADLQYQPGIFQYLNGRWLDVTNKVMPELPDALLLSEYRRVTGSGGQFDPLPVLFDLPRIGKSIKVGIDSDADDEPGHPNYQGDGTVLKLNWNGERFVLEKIR